MPRPLDLVTIAGGHERREGTCVASVKVHVLGQVSITNEVEPVQVQFNDQQIYSRAGKICSDK